MKFKKNIYFLTGCLLFSLGAVAQNNETKKDSIDIELGTLDFSTKQFNIEVLKSSQTLAGLHSVSEPQFDYTPSEWLSKRNKAGYYHLGDINFKIKSKGDKNWTAFSSAKSRKNVKVLKPQNANQLAVSDLSVVIPNSPLQVTRYWEKHGENIVLRFELKNTSKKRVEIGALGIPIVLDNNFYMKHLDQAHEENVFFDPYIGMDAGYIQAVRLKGSGDVLVIMPYGKTPFEGWNPLLDDPTPRGITFEGIHEWMPLTKAYAENEWKNATPWNTPHSATLKPGEMQSYGIEFTLAKSVRNIEQTLIENERPVAVGIPGYVLPQDVNGSLFLNYSKKIRSYNVEPKGALTLQKEENTKHGWYKYAVKGIKWGRARLSITYEDGLTQTINYKVIKPETQVIADNGHFLTTKQWYENKNDKFGRSPSVITYDYEKQEQVTEDQRAWICGLSDEGGAGAWLNAIMKELVEPNKAEISKLEDFVQNTIWGGIQYNSGMEKYGVRKSMFYYQPDSMPKGTYSKDVNYKTWAAWDKKHAMSVERSYNYPHVAAAYWVMYRLARNYEGLVTKQNWDWYLMNAYHTSMAMIELAPYYAQFGQMEGSVFIDILKDLRAEGLWEEARTLEGVMRMRAMHWASLSYPFGSEMPWDSTGQEEVYSWSAYFGFFNMTETTMKAILAYMPTIPHWAYNGCARRYWDFLYGGKAGKTSRIERMIHHYGSAVNAIPVLYEYKMHPEDLYLLRVGYGGLLGSISNITQDGFAPCAFHSFPQDLKNDGISGDYGSGYFGYAVNTSTYLTKDNEFGWLSFGGNISENNNEITVELTTASKSRVYISPLHLWLTLDAGKFKSVTYNKETQKVSVKLEAANEYTPKAYLRIKEFKMPVWGENEKEEKKFEAQLENINMNNRGQYEIPLKETPLSISIN